MINLANSLSISVPVQSLSHVQLCDPMDCSTSGFPAHHQLPGLAQTHVHQIFDVIQPHHPLSFLSPPTFNLSQHQGLFQWVSYSHQVAKVLEFQLQHQSFQWTPRTNLLFIQSLLSGIAVWIITWIICIAWTGWISFQSKGLSRVFSNTTVQKHQFFGAQLSL